MGVYNVLHADVPCRKCGRTVRRELQFKYGKCYLYDLRPGDAVTWATGKGRTLNRGAPASGRAWVPAYPQTPCPECGDEATRADFAVVVNHDVVEGAVQAPLGFFFREDEDVVPLDDGQQPPVSRE